MKEDRTRNWAFILYPESCVSNWEEILDDLHIEWVKSPLHDKDINADGEPKKAHYHILLTFTTLKSYSQIIEITNSINGTIPQKIHNVRSMVRYFAHLDNPEKYQYNVSDIIGHGGVDLQELLKKSSSERYSIIKDMLDFINKNKIIEFQDLVDYAYNFEFDSWFPLLCDNSTIFITNYIRSCRHRLKPKIDLKTGEIL